MASSAPKARIAPNDSARPDQRIRDRSNAPKHHGAGYSRAVENFAGVVELPVGLTRRLRVNGAYANGAYQLPLATTEAALVASYSRGARVITEAGGCGAAVTAEAIDRAPGFAFRTLAEAHSFARWVETQHPALSRIAEAHSAHTRLVGVRALVEGNHVYLNLSFTTGDAAGQNMATFASAEICAYIQAQAPTKPLHFFLEVNHTGDKKATAVSLAGVRGKRVTAEIVLPEPLVRRRLAVAPGVVVDCWRMGMVGSILSGAIGAQAHFANGLAALYIACGQDAACVAESAIGVTRCELTADGDLYAAVTLPNVVVGAVGGGVKLPSQQRWLEAIGLPRENAARALAELCAALCLAGEVSILAALGNGAFSRAHRILSRRGSGTTQMAREHP